jgi:hypothetical protein
MKVNKNFTLDIDIVEKLAKFDNCSNIVNALLKDYLSCSNQKNDILEQKIALLKQNKAKMRAINKEIRIFKTLNLLDFDQKCINWVLNKEFKFTDEEIDNYKYSRKLKISIETFKKCIELIKNNGYLFKHS